MHVQCDDSQRKTCTKEVAVERVSEATEVQCESTWYCSSEAFTFEAGLKLRNICKSVKVVLVIESSLEDSGCSVVILSWSPRSESSPSRIRDNDLKLHFERQETTTSQTVQHVSIFAVSVHFVNQTELIAITQFLVFCQPAAADSR